MPLWVGWLATAITVSSYFFKKPVTLRWIQASAAVLWLAYGLMIHSGPVIVANIFVMGAAIGSTYLRAFRTPEQTQS